MIAMVVSEIPARPKIHLQDSGSPVTLCGLRLSRVRYTFAGEWRRHCRTCAGILRSAYETMRTVERSRSRR